MEQLKSNRITSIDLLRGTIMIIMALDHVRDYFHKDVFYYDPLDLERTSVILYFTRWITNFCAPIFCLLAGTSAFISGQRKTKKELSLFLFKRGLWLIFLELTVVNFAWFFNFEFTIFLLAVIWALGASMIILSVLIHLPRRIILVIGIVVIAGHNLLNNVHFPQHDALGFTWGFLHDFKIFPIGAHHAVFWAYPILPWAAAMALGYCMGSLYTRDYDPAKRKGILLKIGFGSVILFFIIRAINVYGNIFPWTTQSTTTFSFLSFMNVSKYPPSLDYMLITEGIGLIFLAYTENISNRVSKIISVYGRVPMFYYLLHLYLIHILSVFGAVYLGYNWSFMTGFQDWLTNLPRMKGYGFNLGIVYLVWIFVVVALYPLCKWYDRYKTVHKEKWWLSYL